MNPTSKMDVPCLHADTPRKFPILSFSNLTNCFLSFGINPDDGMSVQHGFEVHTCLLVQSQFAYISLYQRLHPIRIQPSLLLGYFHIAMREDLQRDAAILTKMGQCWSAVQHLEVNLHTVPLATALLGEQLAKLLVQDVGLLDRAGNRRKRFAEWAQASAGVWDVFILLLLAATSVHFVLLACGLFEIPRMTPICPLQFCLRLMVLFRRFAGRAAVHRHLPFQESISMDLIPQKRLHSLQIHVDGTAGSFAPGRETVDLRGCSHSRCAAGDRTEDDASGADLRAAAHGDIPRRPPQSKRAFQSPDDGRRSPCESVQALILFDENSQSKIVKTPEYVLKYT